MQVMSRAIGLLVVFSAVIMIPVAIWIYAALGVALNPDTYKDGLANQNVYPDIVPVALPALAREINQQAAENGEQIPLTFSQIIQGLRPDDWQAIANELVPPDWLRIQIESAIDAIFTWINSDNTEFLGSVNVSEIRDRLSGDEGQRVVNRIIEVSPQCSTAQVAVLVAISNERSSAQPPLCKPPGQYIAVTSSLLSETLARTVQGLDEDNVQIIDLLAGETPDAREEFINSAQAARLIVQSTQQVILLFFLCPAALLAILVILTIRSLQGFGRWMGITALIAGVLALIPLPFAPLRMLFADSALSNSTVVESAQIREFFSRLTFGFQQSIVDGFNMPVLMLAAAFIGVGFLLLGIAAIVPSPEEREEIIAEKQATSSVSTPRTITINVPTDDL